MISSGATRKAGPFSGNGLTTSFPFSFKVFQASDLLVVLTDSTGTQVTQTLTSQYTVALNSNQDSNPGGSINMVAAPASGYTLTVGSVLPALQMMVLTNNGGFFPTVLNAMADYLTILVQQLYEIVGRSLTLPFSAPSNVSTTLPLPAANKALKWDAAGTAIVNSTNDVDTAIDSATTQAGIATTQAGIATTQAGNASASAIAAAASAASAASVLTGIYADATGSADAVTATYPSAPSALTKGYSVMVGITTPNATTTPTFAPTLSGVAQTARTIVKEVGGAAVALAAGDLQGIVTLVYDLTNTRWVVQDPAFAQLAGSSAQQFAVAKATSSTQAVRLDQLDPAGLYKLDALSPVFVKTAAGTISIKAGASALCFGTKTDFAANTAVVMPSLTGGTDYAIYICTDGTVRADASFTNPTGYTTANSRLIGGFHYAPGENATGTTGGNTTPAINAYSIWDLKFKPSAIDPRGMTLVADSFWADIYLLNVNHHTNGSSKYNVTIADGSSPPKIPAKFGGNGTTAYSTLNWWEANEVLQSFGKRSPTYDEFAALAYGTTEAASIGTDQVSTVLNAAYTSKWGCIQSSGVMWVWGANFGGGAVAAGWVANTGGRGSTYQMENAVLFGGAWGVAADAGSRSSGWYSSPTNSVNIVGARGVCDHLILD